MKNVPTLLVLNIFIVIGVTACSQSPALSLKEISGTIGLTNKIAVQRYRQLMISPNSHIGLMVNSSLEKDLFIKTSTNILEEVFSKVSLLKEGEEKPSSIDFLIKAKLLDTVAHNKKVVNDGNGTENPISLNTDVDGADSKRGYSQFRPSPYQATIKLILIDARKKKAIDIAIVESRSGVIVYEGYRGFLQESLRAYTRTLVSRNPGYDEQASITY